MRAGLSIELINFIDTFIFPGEENTIQESFIIWAYIVYISDYTNSQFSDNI